MDCHVNHPRRPCPDVSMGPRHLRSPVPSRIVWKPRRGRHKPKMIRYSIWERKRSRIRWWNTIYIDLPYVSQHQQLNQTWANADPKIWICEVVGQCWKSTLVALSTIDICSYWYYCCCYTDIYEILLNDSSLSKMIEEHQIYQIKVKLITVSWIITHFFPLPCAKLVLSKHRPNRFRRIWRQIHS